MRHGPLWLHAFIVPFIFFSGCAAQSHHSAYASSPSALLEQGRVAHAELEHAASAEGFLQKLFGVACYSQALRALGSDCRRLSEDERCRLAFSMAGCFMRHSTGAHLPTSCPSQKSIQQCTSGLDDRAFQAYTQFYSNIHSICLFIQNQDFLKQAEALTASLHSASVQAWLALHDVNANLTAHKEELSQLGNTVSTLADGTAQVSAQVAEGLAQTSFLAAHTMALGAKMNQTLGLQEALHSRQLSIAAELADLSEEETRRARVSSERWQAAELAASALEARQAASESLQQRLAAASDALAIRAGSLQSALDVVLHYERRSDRFMTYMLGSSYTFHDIAYHGTTTGSALLLGSVLPYSLAATLRVPLLCCAVGGLAAERGALAGASALGWAELGQQGNRVFLKLPLGPLAWLLPRLSEHLPADPTSPPPFDHDHQAYSLPSTQNLALDPRWLVRILTLAAALMLVIKRVLWCASEERSTSGVLQALEQQMQILQASHMELLHAVRAGQAGHRISDQPVGFLNEPYQQHRQQLACRPDPEDHRGGLKECKWEVEGKGEQTDQQGHTSQHHLQHNLMLAAPPAQNLHRSQQPRILPHQQQQQPPPLHHAPIPTAHTSSGHRTLPYSAPGPDACRRPAGGAGGAAAMAETEVVGSGEDCQDGDAVSGAAADGAGRCFHSGAVSGALRGPAAGAAACHDSDAVSGAREHRANHHHHQQQQMEMEGEGASVTGANGGVKGDVREHEQGVHARAAADQAHSVSVVGGSEAGVSGGGSTGGGEAGVSKRKRGKGSSEEQEGGGGEEAAGRRSGRLRKAAKQ